MQTAQSIRGLDERAYYALAVIDFQINQTRENRDKIINAYKKAYFLGADNYMNGLSEPPLMIKDVPKLLMYWEDGFEDAETVYQMKGCSNCSDHTGNPCGIHG